MNESLRKTAILIAGTHRSGTSALTRVLSILGCDLPKTLLTASGSNVTGFWESTLINRLNDDILAEFGQRWFDLANIDHGLDPERLAPFRQRALELLHDEFGDADLFLIKDPRLCRLMPFWLEVLSTFEAKPVAVLPIRNPIEVAASLFERNGFEPAVSHFIWLRNVLDAEAGSRSIPRTFTHYEALIEDWRTVVGRIASELGLAWPNFTPVAQAEIASFLSTSLRHHVEPPEAVMRNPDVPGWVRGAFGVVDQWARAGEEPTGYDVLDRIRNELDATGLQFNGIFELAKSNRLKLRQLSEQQKSAASALSNSQMQARADSLQIEAMKSRLSTVTRDLTARLADATVDTVQLQVLQEKLEEISARAAHSDIVVRSQEAEAANLRSQIADHVVGIAARDTRIADMETRLARKRLELEARTQQVSKSTARVKDLVTQLKKSREDLGVRSRRLAASSESIKRHDAAVQRFKLENSRLKGALADTRHELGEKIDRLAEAEQRLDRSLGRRAARALAGLTRRRRGEAQLTDFLAASELFDADWYRSRYPDVVEGGIDPAKHYIVHGASEGRDPGPRFSTRGYLATNPDVAAAGINPLVHYLKFGRVERRRLSSVPAGPTPVGGAMPTVQAPSDAAPLTRGRTSDTFASRVKQPAQGRSEDDLVALVSADPLFDRTWYLAQYPDSTESSTDPAIHYVRLGGTGKYDPGPDFSSSWYLDRHPRVAAAGTNPLVHYLLHGRANGRQIAPSVRQSAAAAGKIDSGELEEGEPPLLARPAAAEPSSFLERPAAECIWVRQLDLQSAPGDHPLLLGGLVLARAAAAPAGAEPGHQQVSTDGIDIFCRLTGFDEPRGVRSDTGASTAGRDVTLTSETVRGAIALRVSAYHAEIIDIWFLNDSDLRLRISRQIGRDERQFVIRFYQYEPSRQRIVCAGEGAVDSIETSFVDARLVNPYLPLLMAFTTPDGRLSAVSVLPFPSLCRGGAHYAELCAVGQDSGLTNNFTAYSAVLLDALLAASDPTLSHVEVDLTVATGAERIFSPLVREWLAVIGVGLSPTAAAEVMDTLVHAYLLESLAVPDLAGGSIHAARIEYRKAVGTSALLLPATALPSLRALAARVGGLPGQKGPAAGSFVVASSDLADPQWVVTMPPLGDVLLRSQPTHMGTRLPVLSPIDGRDARAGDTAGAAALVAVQFNDLHRVADASLLMPVAPDASGPIIPVPSSRPQDRAASVTVLIPSCGDGGAGLSALLASLQLQTIVGHLTVVALANAANSQDWDAADELLSRYFEGRYRLLDHRDGGVDVRLDVTAAEASGELLLTTSIGIVLHDHRTLEALASLALTEGVASAGCMLLAMDTTKKKPTLEVRSLGHFVGTRPTRPHLTTIVPGDAHPALACATFPVAANTPLLTMLRTSLWRDLGGFVDDEAGNGGRIGYWRRALRLGFVHLSTSAISATIVNDQLRAPLDDDAPRWTSEDDDWHAVTSRAASLKRLRG